ncbi:MAG: CcmD family protein [Bacteroidetes bacterium]|nr:CcmD family protein [Bacteroidota bacterium]
MKKIVSSLFGFLFLLINTQLPAQDAQMADTMRSEGKIYVVVAILLVILTGLIVFLVFTDRKVSKLEKRLEGNKQ